MNDRTDDQDELTNEAQQARTESGRSGDLGADTSDDRLEQGKNAQPGGGSDVARSQMPDVETAAQRETSQAGADSTSGGASHEVDPFDEDTEVEG
ncbi:MAG TPA: hypothetical protein VFO84_05600 [Dehalococcoidia bacterium]|nr:hypothetical protein [Dehalococcoidia bacterium]